MIKSNKKQKKILKNLSSDKPNIIKISDKEFNKLTFRQQKRIMNNRISAKKSDLKRKKYLNNLSSENKILKENIKLSNIYFNFLNYLNFNFETINLSKKELNMLPKL